MGREAIFFDRDGVITKTVGGEAPQNPSQLQLNPGISRVLWTSKKLGYSNFVVSNQPDRALGKIDEQTRQDLVDGFQSLVEGGHLPIDEIYYCFHHPQEKCECRKPNPGMILQAAAKYQLDLSNSFVVGDKASDIKAGKEAGTRAILFDQDRTQNPYLKLHKVSPDHTATSLDEISSIIIKENHPHIKAMVLAAGKGDRMMPLTANTPKPLLKITERPMIEYVINLLTAHGVCNIGINLHYLGDMITSYLGDGQQLNTNLTYVKEDSLTGTAGGVRSIADAIQPQKPFYVISSDMMVNFDLTSAYQFHMSHDGIATLCCYWRSLDRLVAGKSGVVSFDPETCKIDHFIERPKTPEDIISQWVNSSVYIFNPEILDYIPTPLEGLDPIDFPKDIFPKLLADGKKLYAYPVDHRKYYQLGIDSYDRLLKVKDDIRQGKFIPTVKKILS